MFAPRSVLVVVAASVALVGNIVVVVVAHDAAGTLDHGSHRGIGRDLATTIVLSFEGLGDSDSVDNYYDGGAGPNYGVSFSSTAIASVAPGGSSFYPNPPSGDTVLLFFPVPLDRYVDVASGFLLMNFFYVSEVDEVVKVYDGFSGTGNELMSINLPSASGWTLMTLPIVGGVAKSATFTQNGYIYLDDMTILLAPVPPTNTPTRPPTKPPARPPTKPPTRPPTKAPTRPPTKPPTVPPTKNPTAPPTKSPTKPPTKAPTRPPTKQPTLPPCTKTTYWLWNPSTDKVVRELVNNTSSCIAQPYNIEVRPCKVPAKRPVCISLQSASSGTTKDGKEGGGGYLVTTQDDEYYPPFFLWGDKTSTGDVYPNKKALSKGTYYLTSKMDGKVEKIKFTQTC